MKVRFDVDVDAMTISLSDHEVARTIEVPEGLVDVDSEGNIIAIEVFAVTKLLQRMERPPENNLERELRGALNRYIADAKRRVGASIG